MTTARITLKAAVSKVTQRLSRVAIAGIERFGPNIADVKKQTISAVYRQLDFMHTRQYRRATDGTVFCLYYADGWQYDILHPSAPNTSVPTSCRLADTRAYCDALRSFNEHFEQFEATTPAS